MNNKTRFTSGELGLTVFSPDTIRSHLLGTLEREVVSLTGCAPVARQWFQHTPSSIECFYQESIPNNTPHWHLVSALFQSGPSLAVIWQGENVIAKLDELKGSSHPAEAKAESIRGRYWCDNPVMNLLHVSDDAQTAINEIEIITACSRRFDIGGQKLECIPETKTINSLHVEHSGILTFLRMIKYIVEVKTNIRLTIPDFPKHGQARLTQEIAKKNLLHYAEAYPTIAPCIEAFLTGSTESIDQLETFLPLTFWDRTTISCGLVARKQWNRAPLMSAIDEIRSILPNDEQWLFSGSASLALHGVKNKPRDIDIWCSNNALQKISRLLNKKITPYSVTGWQGEAITWCHSGWEVEVVGPLTNTEGVIVSVDEHMLSKAIDHIEPIEDLVSELFLLRRPAPKYDLQRALNILTSYPGVLDREYLSWRLQSWSISESMIDMTST